jgi:hypothetical protein
VHPARARVTPASVVAALQAKAVVDGVIEFQLRGQIRRAQAQRVFSAEGAGVLSG